MRHICAAHLRGTSARYICTRSMRARFRYPHLKCKLLRYGNPAEKPRNVPNRTSVLSYTAFPYCLSRLDAEKCKMCISGHSRLTLRCSPWRHIYVQNHPNVTLIIKYTVLSYCLKHISKEMSYLMEFACSYARVTCARAECVHRLRAPIARASCVRGFVTCIPNACIPSMRLSHIVQFL